MSEWRLDTSGYSYEPAFVVDMLHAIKLAHDAGYNMNGLPYDAESSSPPIPRLFLKMFGRGNYYMADFDAVDTQWTEEELQKAFGEESEAEWHIGALLNRPILELRFRLPKVERLCAAGMAGNVQQVAHEIMGPYIFPLDELLNPFHPDHDFCGPPSWGFLFEMGLLRPPDHEVPVGIYFRMADYEEGYDHRGESQPRFLDMVAVVKAILAIDQLYEELFGDDPPDVADCAIDWPAGPFVLERDTIGIDQALAKKQAAPEEVCRHGR